MLTTSLPSSPNSSPALLAQVEPLPQGLSPSGLPSLTGLEEGPEALQAAHEQALALNQALTQRVQLQSEEIIALQQTMQDFLYTVSHDLRAPLNSIDGFNQLLQREVKSLTEAAAEPVATERDQEKMTRVRHYASRLRAGVHDLSGLLDALLALSRVSRAPLHPVPFNLSAVVQRNLAQRVALEPTRTAEIHVQEGLLALGDSSLLTLMLDHLLDNAWKFSGASFVTDISFTGAPDTEAPESRWRYQLKDAGVGFDMALAPKLFTVFQHFHSRSEFPGVGIGLAIAQKIIHRHGGRIWADSQPGAGTSFYFSLPVPSSNSSAALFPSDP